MVGHNDAAMTQMAAFYTLQMTHRNVPATTCFLLAFDAFVLVQPGR